MYLTDCISSSRPLEIKERTSHGSNVPLFVISGLRSVLRLTFFFFNVKKPRQNKSHFHNLSTRLTVYFRLIKGEWKLQLSAAR